MGRVSNGLQSVRVVLVPVIIGTNFKGVESAQTHGLFGVKLTTVVLHRASDRGEATNTGVEWGHVLTFVNTKDLSLHAGILLSGDVEEVHTREDDKESKQKRDDVDSGSGVEALEQNEGSYKGACGKSDVVKRVNDGGIKLIQSLVEVVHLGENAEGHDNDEDVSRQMSELVVSSQSELEGNTKGLDSHDGDGAHAGADRDVDHGVGQTVHWGDFVDHEGRVHSHHKGVEKEARLGGVVQDLVDGLDVLVRRSMEDNDHGAHKADGTTHLAQDSELLLEENSSQDCANDHRQGTQWSDQNGWGKSVGSKVGNLTDSHGNDACPPNGVVEILEALGIVGTQSRSVHQPFFRDDERGADRQRR